MRIVKRVNNFTLNHHSPNEDILDEIAQYQVKKGPAGDEPVVYRDRGIYLNGENYLALKLPVP